MQNVGSMHIDCWSLYLRVVSGVTRGNTLSPHTHHSLAHIRCYRLSGLMLFAQRSLPSGPASAVQHHLFGCQAECGGTVLWADACLVVGVGVVACMLVEVWKVEDDDGFNFRGARVLQSFLLEW